MIIDFQRTWKLTVSFIKLKKEEHDHNINFVTSHTANCDFKILEPSFPPSVPPEPPPRKYGIFVSRPPGQRKTSLATALAATSPPKIGFK